MNDNAQTIDMAIAVIKEFRDAIHKAIALESVARLSQSPRSRPCHLTSSCPAEMRTSLSYIVIVLIYCLIRVVPGGVYKGVHIPVCEVGDVCHGLMHGAPCGHKQAPTP